RKLIRVICETGDNENEKAIDPLRESDAGIRPWSRASPDPCGANRKTAEQLYGRELPRCRHKERSFKIDQAAAEHQAFLKAAGAKRRRKSWSDKYHPCRWPPIEDRRTRK